MQLNKTYLINCYWDNNHQKKVMFYPRNDVTISIQFRQHTISTQINISFMVILIVSKVDLPDLKDTVSFLKGDQYFSPPISCS